MHTTYIIYSIFLRQIFNQCEIIFFLNENIERNHLLQFKIFKSLTLHFFN